MKTFLKEKLKSSPFFEVLDNLRNSLSEHKYLEKYNRFISGSGKLSDIEVISIEFCSICNLSCRYCFLEKKERLPFLDFQTYKKLLDEVAVNKKYRIKIMEWPISGSFFLHPQYKEIIEITGEYEKRYPNFKPWIILNDNMMLFDKEKADLVMRSGIINQIICSIDGVDRETFEYMRPKADFGRVLENTRYLFSQNKSKKNRIIMQINNGVDGRCTGKTAALELKEILNRADLATYWKPLDWNQSFHKTEPKYTPYSFFCSFALESVSLSSSGAVIKCCMDLKEDTKYADFTKETIESIWFSEERKSFLRLMREGKRQLLPGCASCSIKYVRQNKH